MEDAVRIVLEVAAEEDGERLDRLIAARVAEISRSYAQSLVKAGHVYVNGEPARPARRIHEGDTIEILLPPVPEPADLTPQHIPVPAIYEDDDVRVRDKPAGRGPPPA